MPNDPGKDAMRRAFRRAGGNVPVLTSPAFNGTALQPPAVSITYTAGPVANLHIEKAGGGDFQVFIAGVIRVFTAASIALTEGTDTVPVLNYVWIELIADVATLQTSTTEFPASVDYVACAVVLLQTAASAQTYGAYKVHAWTDHVGATLEPGHFAHLNEWIRNQQATWRSGCTPTLTIVSGPSPDDVFFDSTAGNVLQLHGHDFPAMDMDGVDEAYVVNDPTTPYDRITNLNTVLTDASGGSMTGRSFSLVFWGVASENDVDSQLMVNLPIDTYSGGAPAVLDADAFTVYQIPTQFRGTGFLIARVTLSHSNSGGGTWTLEETADLRGLLPNSSAGAASSATDLHIGNSSLTLEANRTIDDGNNGYILFFEFEDSGGQKVQFLMNPNVPSILVQANDGAGNITAYTIGSANMNLAFTGTSDLRINGAVLEENEVVIGQGTGVPPIAEHLCPPIRFLFADFMYNGANNNNPYFSNAILGGNTSGAPSTASLVDGMGVVLIRSTTTANSGNGWRESTNKNAGKGDLYFRCILWVDDDFANKKIYFGHHNGSTATEPTRGSYFILNGSGVVTPKSADSTRTSGSTFTISADTWYIFEILWNADATSINFKILSLDKATTHLDVDITTNISTGLMGAGLIAVSTGAVADNLCSLDYMGHGFKNTR